LNDIVLHNRNPAFNYITGDNSLAGGLTLSSFSGKNNFWIEYGCHFEHVKTTLDINTPVPEPNTFLLLGFRLLGLAGLARKKV